MKSLLAYGIFLHKVNPGVPNDTAERYTKNAGSY